MDMLRIKILPFVLFVLVLFSSSLHANDTIRVGALRFGTVNWHLNVMKHHQLDTTNNFQLSVIPLASKNAAAVALQGGSVDIIVGDWFWVIRQNTRGKDYLFVPYSQAAGGILLAHNSPITSLSDLTGRTIGVAGGKIDKSWLITRAFMLKTQQRDPADDNTITYGAPPLLSQLLKKDKLDAVLTFWHYQARLRFHNHTVMSSVPEMIQSLGISHPVPINGWIFSKEWAQRHPERVAAFINASQRANDIMNSSDAEWQRLATIMPPQDRPALQQLKQGYIDGIPHFTLHEAFPAMQQLFSILKQLGGTELVGDAHEIPPSILWNPSHTQP